MKKLVAIGSTTLHDYSFFLPLTALFWRRVGYEPWMLLAEDRGKWASLPHADIVIRELELLGVPTVPLGSVLGAEPAQVAQSCRHHAAALPFDSDSILIPSDADLWPLGRDFYHQHDPAKHAIALYYANGYGSRLHFPTCHQSMTAAVWREVMGLPPDPIGVEGLREYLTRAFRDGGMAERKGLDVRFFDEHYSSLKIRQSRFYPGQVQFIDRQGGPPKDRIDRSCWPARISIEGMTDTHLLRPGYTDENWPRIRPIVEQAMPDRLAWADDYAKRFKEAMPRG